MTKRFSSLFVFLLLGACAARTPAPAPTPEAAPEEAPAAASDEPEAPASSSTPAADVKWAPLNPEKPDGPQLAVLNGNPAEGAFSALVKVPAGFSSGLHTHPVNFTGVAVAGSLGSGRTVEDAKTLAVGDLWTDTAGEAHVTVCSEDAECIFVGYMEGAMAMNPEENPAEASTMSLTAAGDIAYNPVNPEKPEGPGMVVLTGDMTAGAFTALVRFPAGAQAPEHSHTASYSAAVVSGVVSHGGPDGLSAGSHWTQAGGGAHTTGCNEGADCVFFVSMDGAMDMTPTAPPADEAAVGTEADEAAEGAEAHEAAEGAEADKADKAAE